MFTSPPPEYLFKADDDVFVNLPLLYEKLCGPYEMGGSARGPYDNVTNLLIGNLYEGNRTKVRKVGNCISCQPCHNNIYHVLTKIIYKSDII